MPSSNPASRTAVLGDPNLVREVLANLGSDVTECHAALLVNRFWLTALKGADPWMHILRRKFSSMAVPGCFRRTAKELLRLRLEDADPQLREEEEIRRLEKDFQNKDITILVRHPTHNLVAECKIPIICSRGCIDFSKANHPLTVHRVLPVSEYGRCEVALQMPGGLDLLVYRNFEIHSTDDTTITEVEECLEPTSGDAASTTAAEGAGTTKTHLRWEQWPTAEDGFSRKCAGFIDDHDHVEPICLTFCVTCTYPTSLDVQSMLEDAEEYDALYEALPTAVTEASITVYSYPCDGSSRFRYLKLIENWMVVARHLRDDVTELARLRSRFEETYLLVDVGLGPDLSRWNQATRRFEPNLPVSNASAFALVPLANEAAVLALFRRRSTQVQLVAQEGRVKGLPSVEEDHIVYISALDLQTNRVVKLGKGMESFDDFQDERFGFYDSIGVRSFDTFSQSANLVPCFREEVAASGVKGAATVRLSVEIPEYDDIQPQFHSILDLWKFLEICLTGELKKC